MQIQRKSNGSAALRIAGRLIFSSAFLLAVGGIAALVVSLLFCHKNELAFNPAVELSYLKPEEQKGVLDAMEYSQNTPSLSQAQRLKKLSREGKCTQDAMYKVMSEEKKDELDRVTLKSDTLRKYFPKNYTPQQMEQVIIKLLDQWQKKRQRQNER